MVHYKDIGKLIQIERNHAHVDVQALQAMRGDDYHQSYITKDQAIQLFNDTAEKVGLQPMRDPKGYMTLDDNLMSAIKDYYDEVYQDAYDAIENGQGYGTTYAVGYILDNFDKVVRKDVTSCLPKGVNYGDLRFMKTTPEMEPILQDMANARLEVTITKSISRQFDQGAVEKSVQKFYLQKERFQRQLVHELGMDQEQGMQL